jgi:hypothetical protein
VASFAKPTIDFTPILELSFASTVFKHFRATELGFFKLDFTVNGLERSRLCSITIFFSLAGSFIGLGLELLCSF